MLVLGRQPPVNMLFSRKQFVICKTIRSTTSNETEEHRTSLTSELRIVLVWRKERNSVHCCFSLSARQHCTFIRVSENVV